MTSTKRSRLRKVVAATAAVVGISIAAAGAAQAAGGGTIHAGSDYASSSVWVNGGWQARAYARHGNISKLSAWTRTSTGVTADSGTSNIYAASGEFKTS